MSAGLSLDQEITDTVEKSDSNDPRLFSPEVPDVKSKDDHVHFDEEGPTVVLSSSFHSEGKSTRADFVIQKHHLLWLTPQFKAISECRQKKFSQPAIQNKHGHKS